MKEIFKYTFLSLKDIKKTSFIVAIFSILTILQALPVISIMSFFLEKLLYINMGLVLIYIYKITTNKNEFFATLKKQSLPTFFLHFIPAAAGLFLGLFLIFIFFIAFFVIILKFTNSLYILVNVHNVFMEIANSNILTQMMLGFFSIYLMFYSYIFLGKLGEALDKETFKESFFTIISSLIDFKFWVNSFNLEYFKIYFIWSIINFSIYTIVAIFYIIVIFPTIQFHPDISLIVIPLLVLFTTTLTFFTFFSSYKAYKTTL